ncbi:MAG: hypothetical protein ABI180_09180, partial [Microcoleus sp.]
GFPDNCATSTPARNRISEVTKTKLSFKRIDVFACVEIINLLTILHKNLSLHKNLPFIQIDK